MKAHIKATTQRIPKVKMPAMEQMRIASEFLCPLDFAMIQGTKQTPTVKKNPNNKRRMIGSMVTSIYDFFQ